MIKIRELDLFIVPENVTKVHIEKWLSHAYNLGKDGRVLENFRIEKDPLLRFVIRCDELTEQFNIKLDL
jgi:hypothetical protein